RQPHPWGERKFSGRNESEREVAPKVSSPGGRARNCEGEGCMARRKPIDTTSRSGGVVSDGTRTRTRRATGETLLVPTRKGGSWVGRITGNTGKSADDERVTDGLVVATKRSNVRGAKGPCCSTFFRQHGRQGRDDKDAHQSARPEAEELHQGEGRHGLALLGPVRSRLQAGNPQRGLPAGQEEQRGSGYRRGHLRGHRGGRRRGVPQADSRRTGRTQVSSDAEPAAGETQGPRQGPRPRHSRHPGSRGPGGTQAHPGTHLRGRLPTGVVWLPTRADSP